MRLGGTYASTISEIDTELIKAHWAYLHAVWQDETAAEEAALDLQNRLLEARFQATQAAR